MPRSTVSWSPFSSVRIEVGGADLHSGAPARVTDAGTKKFCRVHVDATTGLIGPGSGMRPDSAPAINHPYVNPSCAKRGYWIVTGRGEPRSWSASGRRGT